MSYSHRWHFGSRRTFLKQSAISLMALPFLRSRSYAAGAPPVRLIIMTALNGLVTTRSESSFQCTGSDTSLVLAPQFAALEPVKNKVVAFKGLNNNILAGSNFVSAGHDPAVHSILTARSTKNQGSVDQFLAQQINAPTPHNIALALFSGAKTGFFTSVGAYVPLEQSPAKLLNSYFANVPLTPVTPTVPTTPTTPVVDMKAARARKVLDFVRQQNANLKAELCGAERVMLDSHIDAVERAQKAIVDMPTSTGTMLTAGCSKPLIGSGYDPLSMNDMAKTRDAQVEVVAMAAACQVTPVISYALRSDGDAEKYPFLSGVDPGAIYHDYAHGGGPAKTIINGFVVETFNKLVLRLSQIQDTTGSVLDNSIVMLVSDQRFGGEFAHDVANIPVVVAGGGGGRIKGGRMLAYSGESFHKILTSICQVMGVNTNAYGDAGVSSGGLPRFLI